MKRLILLLVTMVGLLIGSCHHRKITKMSIWTNADYLKIEYSGNIVFNDANTDIVYISPNGYFKCKNKEDELIAQSTAKNHIDYELNGERQNAQLNTQGRMLLKDAIKEIAKQRQAN
ncbi:MULTISPECIES: hypothetical protein [unclassified Mucilaginibacter]|uniref:hypothetical protein n=1 Tax=unclassified Mucilaginibacter TaxID=2617802 RepID=UPI0031F661EB